MKPKSLILISALIIIVLLSLFNGNGGSKFGFYTSQVSNSITSIWNNSTSVGRYNGSKEEISFPKIPVIVVYKSRKVGDINSLNPLKIDISDKDFGPLWIPAVKISSYNFLVPCKVVHEIKTGSVIGKFIVNGEIYVSGHYQIIGSCSTEKATNVVVDKILNDIYKEIKKKIK